MEFMLGSTVAAAPRSTHPAPAHAPVGAPSLAVIPPAPTHAPDAGVHRSLAVATPSPPHAHAPVLTAASAPVRAPRPSQDYQGTSNPWDQRDVQVKEHQQKRAKLSELDIYLKEDLCPQGDGFDILNWWSVNENKYPIISCIAKDVLAAPASTVASESAFSTGGRVLSDYKSRLIGSTVEALICLQD